MRLLVLRPGAIGDTLVTLPALLALRRRFPDARITLAGNPAALPLVQASGVIDDWLSFDSAQVGRLFLDRPPADDDPFLGLDAAVAWCGDSDGVLQRSLSERGARQLVIASSRPTAGRAVHVAQQLVETLAPLGPPAIATGVGGEGDVLAADHLDRPVIALPADAMAEAERELTTLGLVGRPFVAVHPGSGSRAKNWPAEQFAAVIDALAHEHGLPSLILAGPADDDVLARLAVRTRSSLAVLAGRPLTVVAGVLQQARAFLGNDSGLAHLAGQLGVSTLALFGPTDPAEWSPLGPRVRTLRSEPLADLPVETVLSALLAAHEIP